MTVPSSRHSAPPRLERPSAIAFILLIGLAAFFLTGLQGANINPERLIRGVSNLGTFFGEAMPPNFSRWDVIATAMLETFQMAIVGVVFGVILSLPMALLCARNTSPHPVVRVISRNIVATLRTVPDLVWALIFVVAVGLGPLAGILAIIMDTIGFCARFFSERIEEVDPGPGQALAATGASRSGVICGAILPECTPSFVATSLFSVEKAVRSAVVLGLVGAGGIGVELSASMNLFRYDQALTVILAILVVVIGVEQISAWIRKRVI
ncbi:MULTISPECIES: phosphonate ABC transporter, permease protein PhnE [Halomonadaceae]|jgi:phosphonate transport system permease protein|uniref:Phosphonate ABC transporter, permease protein PhnE n=1 Tax=Billgrantia aerodenitrificans TaxID=2733483 RepID=A0ABS9AXE9_9GAMM|nr:MULTISPECIES: phosphonate ABC transporter, permease protein PhnE [Halomonas]MCE8026430.1 phosphonate ABC transporter, permease protein PhnE [Halomonas aerodenitrificans]MCE8040270.1 phosphonate ABC transporter, permease protein PhnE [Halomonas sp. MCCC 1A11062]